MGIKSQTMNIKDLNKKNKKKRKAKKYYSDKPVLSDPNDNKPKK